MRQNLRAMSLALFGNPGGIVLIACLDSSGRHHGRIGGHVLATTVLNERSWHAIESKNSEVM